MKKVIFWDFDGTLVKPIERFELALFEAMTSAGYKVEYGIIKQYLRSVFPWLNYDKSYPNATDKWWDRFLSSLSGLYESLGVKSDDRKTVSDRFRRSIAASCNYELYEDAIATLSECKRLGYENYILSNNFPELPYMLECLKIEKYFSGYVVSALVGYEKPRRELYDYALKLAGVSTAIMVGDNPVADIEGAKNAGLTAVLVHKDCPSVADYTFGSLKELVAVLN